jgi:ribonuclease III
VLKQFLISIKLLPHRGKKFYSLIYKITGISPRNPDYYLLAFQHKSLMHKDDTGQPLNNERLEYLGDAVLGAVVAHELFTRFPERDEGALTKMRARIVNRANMNQLAMELGLHDFIRTQPLGDLAQTHIPGDALEALIGAIYLDRGYHKAREFILNKILVVQSDLNTFIEQDTNHKSLLIEWGQKNKCEIHFVTTEFPGELLRDLNFRAQAFINNILMGEGEGTSKKEAHQNAARNALEKVSKMAAFSMN